MRVAPDNAVPNALPFAPAFRFNGNCNHHCGDDQVAGKDDNDDDFDDKDNKDDDDNKDDNDCDDVQDSFHRSTIDSFWSNIEQVEWQNII